MIKFFRQILQSCGKRLHLLIEETRWTPHHLIENEDLLGFIKASK